MTRYYFNPGCALSIYKPYMEGRILRFLNGGFGEVRMHNICCRHEPKVAQGSVIINVCAGCDRRFRSLYEGVSTVSLWELIDGLAGYRFPDYGGIRMSVHDACPVRERSGVHKAVRSLLSKMNIELVETELREGRSVCCGDDLYPALPVEKVEDAMRKRASSMPCEDVCVYCVSCIKAMHIGGKTPRHLADLLMDEKTEPQEVDIARWHERLQEYIDAH